METPFWSKSNLMQVLFSKKLKSEHALGWECIICWFQVEFSSMFRICSGSFTRYVFMVFREVFLSRYLTKLQAVDPSLRAGNPPNFGWELPGKMGMACDGDLLVYWREVTLLILLGFSSFRMIKINLSLISNSWSVIVAKYNLKTSMHL